MKILLNTTSPFARLVKIVLVEKGVSDLDEQVLNPWGDDAALLAVNPAARVPALITDSGTGLTESLLIVLLLEKQIPDPPLVPAGKEAETVMRRAGLAFGNIEASVHTMIGRVITSGTLAEPEFDEKPVGLRRRRTILTSFEALAKDPPVYGGGTPDLSVILAVIALDYAKFRFARSSWLKDFPVLDALREKVAERPSFRQSEIKG